MRHKLLILGGLALLAAATPAAAATTVIAEIVAKPEGADVIRAALTQASGAAKTEKGCLAYSLYEDRDHAGRFMTYETWTDDASLAAHLASPALQAGLAQLGPLLSQPPVITKLKPL